MSRGRSVHPSTGASAGFDAEVAIIGAGPAGASVAIRLARAGRDVLLIDRTAPPKDKLCGEFLSPESRADLEDLGLGPALDVLEAPRIEHARFTTPSGAVAHFALPETARGLSRRRLDALLWDRARAVGVRTLEAEVVQVTERSRDEPRGARDGGVDVVVHTDGSRRSLRARRLVAAHGRNRRLDRALGETEPTPELRRYAGFKRHHLPTRATSEALEGHVEIHVFEGGYCGMSHVEGGLVNVCALVDTAWLKGRRDRAWPALFEAMARGQPRLEARRRGLEPAEDRPTLSVGAIDLRRRRPVLGPALVVGDASAVIAPLAGDGQAMALSGGRRLAELLLEAEPDAPGARVSAAWARRFHRNYGPRLLVARTIQGALWRPPLAEALVWGAHRWPEMARHLAAWTREPTPSLATTGSRPSLDPGVHLRDR